MNLTVKILEEIRDEIRGTNSRLEAFQHSSEQRFESLEGKVTDVVRKVTDVEQRVAGVERKVTEVEIRLSTSIVEVAASQGQLKYLFTDRLDLRDRVGRCEQSIAELSQRKGR